MGNLEDQAEEQEVLSSIYDSDWVNVKGIENNNENSSCYTMQIDPNVQLFVTLGSQYPSHAAPTYELFAPCLSSERKLEIRDALDRLYQDNFGETVLYQWIEKLKEMVHQTLLEIDSSEKSTCDKLNVVETKGLEESSFTPGKWFDITHGPIIQDRKSIFQGHACRVESEDDVKSVLSLLLDNKKIADATHNIRAYRIKLVKNNREIILKDCEDDGESKAGAVLLELLEVLKVVNVVVIVSRWYGGIRLGPDRFKNIKNAARQVLDAISTLK